MQTTSSESLQRFFIKFVAKYSSLQIFSSEMEINICGRFPLKLFPIFVVVPDFVSDQFVVIVIHY